MSAFQVHSENQDCGKLVKKTKKKLYWRFKLLGCPPYSSTPAVCHELAMIHSFLSGKKNVFLDNRLVHSSATAEPSFHFSCTLGGGRLVTIDFDGGEASPVHRLRIDGREFGDLPFEGAGGGGGQ
ncbi:hypothetical protein ScalyP_jg5069 [Parmales sp. scaly parma]|nr:hypothetical protein ScalyP_jg5069 [Parmales sp. scaly parma]